MFRTVLISHSVAHSCLGKLSGLVAEYMTLEQEGLGLIPFSAIKCPRAGQFKPRIVLVNSQEALALTLHE